MTDIYSTYHLLPVTGMSLTVTTGAGPSLPSQAPWKFLEQREVQTGSDGLETQQLGLRLVLKPDHFTDGRLSLTCLAAIASVYRQQREITVHQSAGRPHMLGSTKPNGERWNGVRDENIPTP